MSSATAIGLAPLLRCAASAACRCAARRWRLDITHTLAGFTVRAEVRSP